MAVSSQRRRIHVVLPVDLVREIDARVGPRQRSEFIQDAVAEKLNRLRRVEAFENAVATPTVGIPAWETRESTAEWLRELRQGWAVRSREIESLLETT
jgi:metal-responsive CopG/Arc/MetJ family transcriptional regulator